MGDAVALTMAVLLTAVPGFVIPVFFVTSGMEFDLQALRHRPSTLVLVPLFLAALLLVRGIPALLYRSASGTDGAVAAELLQATTLPFIVVSTAIGVSLDLITPAAAAFVAASSGPHLPRRRSHLSALGRDVRAGVIGHRTLIRLISLVLAVSTVSCTSVSDGPTAMTSAPRATSASPARDPMLQPFASTSIWNMPIGDEAQLVPAHLAASKQIGNFAEEEVIVLEPNAPMVDLLESHADWNPALDRCVPQPGDIVVDRVPIPSGFVTDPKLGTTDDNAAAILRPDGRTLHQSQPVVRCSNGTATTHYRFDDADI